MSPSVEAAIRYSRFDKQEMGRITRRDEPVVRLGEVTDERLRDGVAWKAGKGSQRRPRKGATKFMDASGKKRSTACVDRV